MTMIQDEIVALVESLVSRQPNEHILKNGNYYKVKLSALFEIDQKLYDAQAGGDEVIRYLSESYAEYTDEITDLIDEYEVVHHDLPPHILVMLNDFANQLFKSRDPDIVDKAQRIDALMKAHKILHCICCALKIGLIEEYIKLLSSYKKALSCLDCSEIKIENVNCVHHLKDRIKTLKNGHRSVKRTFKSFFEKDKFGTKYNFKNIITISELDGILQSCKSLLKQIEATDGVYPKALNLGGKLSVKAQAVNVLMNYIIPGVLTAISLFLWLSSK